MVTPGNEAELPQLAPLLDELRDEGIRPLYLAADKGYDDARTRRELAKAGVQAYMPWTRPRPAGEAAVPTARAASFTTSPSATAWDAG